MPAYEQMKLDLSGLLPLGEKRKLLNKFIVQAEEIQVNNILRDCESLPGTQYNLLKLLLADKFHRSDLMIELLRDGDLATLNGAVTKRWLYEGEDSKLVDCEFLLNELFPNVSRNCRQKVLYRIGRFARNEEEADKIWNAVEQRYGLDVAFPILPACSKVKISSMIGKREFHLSGYQLVHILEKYPDVGMEYLKNVYVGTSKNAYRLPLDYLFEHRSYDFLDICINHPEKIENFKFGRGRSTKIIRTYREKLLEHPTKFSSILKFDRIRREFSNEEFQIFFESTLAGKTLRKATDEEGTDEEGTDEEGTDEMWKWVRAVPINNRIEMVNQAFMKKFQINLDEHKKYMQPEYIVLLPAEKRLSVIQWKMENCGYHSWSFRNKYYEYFEGNAPWKQLKPTSHSVPELQKLLLIEQNTKERAKLSKYLLQTCYINEDLPQLKNVLILLSNRSRNDQSKVRDQIFNTIVSIMQRMEFSKDHWDVIIDMIQVSLIFKDDQGYINLDKKQIVEKCLAFHIKSKLPLNNLVTMYIKMKIERYTSHWSNSYINNIADRRILLDSYVKELENLRLTKNLSGYNGTTLESKSFANFIVNLTEEICKFNSQAKASNDLDPILISSHPWLVASLENIAKEEEDRFEKNHQDSKYDWKFAKQFVDIIETLNEEENLSLEFHHSDAVLSKMLPKVPFHVNFWKNPSSDQDWSTILSKVKKENNSRRWFTNTKSKTPLKVKKCDVSTINFMKKLKFWNYTTIINKIIKICYEMIQNMGKDSAFTTEQKCNAVQVLSILSEPSDFLSLTAEYYPPEKKVDQPEEDFLIRQAFARSLVNVTEPHLTFPAIEKFFIEEYLNHIVGCFDSQTGHAKEVVLVDFLRRKLVNSAVSLQQQIIRQLLSISSMEEKIRILNDIDRSNVSIRYAVFMQANKLLRTSPSREIWSILKTIIEKTSTDDARIIRFLHATPKFNTFPLMEYISDYIETCFVILRKFKPDKVENFIKHIDAVIGKIPEKILDDIIAYIDSDQVSFNSEFYIKYLQSSSSKSILEHRLSNMWSLLQNTIRNGWETRSFILKFISRLCVDKKNDTSQAWLKNQIFQTLLANFKAESATKFFKVIMYLELALMVVKGVDKVGIGRLRLFGQSLAQFMDSLVEMYGGEIICIVIDIVDAYVRSYFSDELRKNGGIVELIDGILEASKSRSNQIISMSFLRPANPEETLEKIDDIVAQIYFITKTY